MTIMRQCFAFALVLSACERIVARRTGNSSALRRGNWLRDGHRKKYGGAYAIRDIRWGASAELIRLANERSSTKKDVYQFGVYTGGSMQGIVRNVNDFGHLYGFDSFIGLPEEAAGVKLEGRHWNTGAFSSADALGAWSTDDLFSRLRRKIGRGPDSLTFIQGFFNDTLNESLLRLHPFQPALLVDIDGDLYVSAVQSMGWMLRSGLLVPGSLVRYDDWKEDEAWGEARAHKELTAEYQVEWRTIYHAMNSYLELELVRCGACPSGPLF
jgi:hypothetical protein